MGYGAPTVFNHRRRFNDGITQQNAVDREFGRQARNPLHAGRKAVATVSLATTETWKDKNTGEKKEATEWHRLVFWGKLAEVVGEYLGKGSQIYVEGRNKTRKWTDKNGVDRYTTEIIVSEMQMLGKKEGGRSE